VLKNQYNVIVHFTCLHNYIDVYARGVCAPLTGDAKTKMHYVCAMLNYILIDNYEAFGIEHVFSVEKRMLDVFFQDYAITKQADGSYRSRQTIETCVFSVTSFFRKLCRCFEGYMKISPKDLYDEKTVFTRRGKLQKTLSPNFKVRTVTSGKVTFRDIPTKVFQVIINQAFHHTPEIVFAICLQAFAGLRPGEVCNVRQECSPLGRGLTITAIGGTVKAVEIDLSAEFVLRSDGVKCGGIKKERRQRVYPAFLPAFSKAYEFHKKFIRNGFEQDYCPMFIGNWGMAMTYFDYRSKF
jgi:integrase